jgi:hypothetical protein
VTAASVANAGALKSVSVPISSAEILALATTPIPVLPGVTGMSYRVLTASLAFVPASKGYVDPAVAINSGQQFTLSSVANAVPQTFDLTGVAQTVYASLTGQEIVLGDFSGAGDPTYGLYGYIFEISGFGNAINNGKFLCAQYGPQTTQLSVSNWGAVSETHAGVASTGTTTYTGVITGGDDNALANQWCWINNFNTPANNGIFWVTASTSTTITVANPAGVAETTSALATCLAESGAQQLMLNIPFYTPTPNSAISSYQVPFGQTVGICGASTPTVNNVSLASYLGYPSTTPGQPVLLVLSNNDFGSAPVALTSGDGSFLVTLTYTEVGV